MSGAAIFISYRRDDSATEAAELYRALVARIGKSLIFKDVDNIPVGEDFGTHIRKILPRCRVVLIVIGQTWVEARDQHGHRRLDDPFDWVRIEVELALAAVGAGNLRVVPVLVNSARMPRANETPTSIHPLLGRNAAIIRPRPHFSADVDRLLRSLGFVTVPEMVAIPAGEFMMGSPAHEITRQDSETPQHRVRIRAFELGKYPVTFAEWDAANASGAGLHEPDDVGWGRDRRPVINVSWNDARDYVAWLNSSKSKGYRLPTEAEWEYACRAGTNTTYSTGSSINSGAARFGSASTVPVGAYPPNGFGLHDMHGSVWEWCEDHYHDTYVGAPSDGSAWIDRGEHRVLRGGSWGTVAEGVRSVDRFANAPGVRNFNIGFRVARTI